MPRFGVFSLIGLAGFAIQTGLLAWLTRVHGWSYGVAVPVTAESSVLMSFVWHMRWTWADRPVQGVRRIGVRLVRYQGVRTLAIAASYVLTVGLVSMLRVAPEIANAMSVAVVSVANFVVGDKVIFR